MALYRSELNGGPWTLLGRLLKTWGGSNPLKSDSYLLLPSRWTELLIDINIQATFDTNTFRMCGNILNTSSSSKLNYIFGGRKQGGFSVMLNINDISSPSVCI